MIVLQTTPENDLHNSFNQRNLDFLNNNNNNPSIGNFTPNTPQNFTSQMYQATATTAPQYQSQPFVYGNSHLNYPSNATTATGQNNQRSSSSSSPLLSRQSNSSASNNHQSISNSSATSDQGFVPTTATTIDSNGYHSTHLGYRYDPSAAVVAAVSTATNTAASSACSSPSIATTTLTSTAAPSPNSTMNHPDFSKNSPITSNQISPVNNHNNVLPSGTASNNNMSPENANFLQSIQQQYSDVNAANYAAAAAAQASDGVTYSPQLLSQAQHAAAAALSQQSQITNLPRVGPTTTTSDNSINAHNAALSYQQQQAAAAAAVAQHQALLHNHFMAAAHSLTNGNLIAAANSQRTATSNSQSSNGRRNIINSNGMIVGGDHHMSDGCVYSFVALPGINTKKRPRRRYDEIERHYSCNFPGCTKSYGTLNHLNAHVQMQKHGPKRHPSEFKELRKQWRRQKREEEERKAAEALIECVSPIKDIPSFTFYTRLRQYGEGPLATEMLKVFGHCHNY
nr:12446_t:CDS:2 [Entrophospora candida]